MSDKGLRMTTVRVQREDWLNVHGRWLEVKAIRPDHYTSGGPAVTFVFKAGPALRVPLGKQVTVRRRPGRGTW
ncbi:hypothetical protein [Streptomyces sp. JJ38]|uniref:hypothetical protein n=1 Tax=Streptomyces sp. JJ38 TaxID=2738128 RepID=UPI001C55A7FA|nr:hypothetical protein [Streptomyces sp. JJ38]MBW1596900.1 hypothetical protein [Streptomyces sp. JJ38]